MLKALQQRVHESVELLKGLNQTQPITSTSAFANYVRDQHAQAQFRKAWSRINVIISELMDEDSDLPEPRRPYLPPLEHEAPILLRRWICIYHLHNLGTQKGPALSTWVPQATYGDQFVQQPVQYQHQQPHNQQMVTPQRGIQSPLHVQMQSSSGYVSAPLGSASQVLHQSPGSNQSLCHFSGLSGELNVSGNIDATSSPFGELNTPPTTKF